MPDFLFTPPVYHVPWATEQAGRAARLLLRYYKGVPTAFTVLVDDGEASPYPGLVAPLSTLVTAADEVFYGGITYLIDEALATVLTEAGYVDHLEAVD